PYRVLNRRPSIGPSTGSSPSLVTGPCRMAFLRNRFSIAFRLQKHDVSAPHQGAGRRGDQDQRSSRCFRADDFSHRVRFCSRIPQRRRAVATNLFVSAIVILALVSASVPLSAHHSWPVSYSQLVTVKGTVTEFMWANPHPMITLEVRTND